MSSDPFSRKRIDVSFGILQDGFDGDVDLILTQAAHRVSCQILAAGMETGVMCALRIEGMKLERMNQLSTVQAGVVAQSSNTVTVSAGSYGSTLQQVFSGGIIEAFVDYSGSPNVAFEVRAMSTAGPSTATITTTSFNASASVDTIMSTIAEKAGLKFQNNGVNSALFGAVYHSGSALDQISSCAQAAGIYYNISMDTLTIWPKSFLADEDGAIEVSSESGLIGYPAYSQGGVGLQCLFNPAIGFRSTIHLSSKYSPAAWVNDSGQLRSLDGGRNVYAPSNGIWIVQRVQHDLQTEEPGGPWITTLEAARPDFAGKVSAFGR